MTMPPEPAPLQYVLPLPAGSVPDTELPPLTSMEMVFSASCPVVPVQSCIAMSTMPPLPPPPIEVVSDAVPRATRLVGAAPARSVIVPLPESTMEPPPAPTEPPAWAAPPPEPPVTFMSARGIVL
jgi:hypothetical protein